MTHSPEPWKVDDFQMQPILDAKDMPVFRAWSHYAADDGLDVTREDLERIVACVNACAGIPTEELLRGAARRINLIEDVYLEGNAVMMQTGEVFIIGDEAQYIQDAETIARKAIDPQPRREPKSPDDITAYIKEPAFKCERGDLHRVRGPDGKDWYVHQSLSDSSRECDRLNRAFEAGRLSTASPNRIKCSIDTVDGPPTLGWLRWDHEQKAYVYDGEVA